MGSGMEVPAVRATQIAPEKNSHKAGYHGRNVAGLPYFASMEDRENELCSSC